ncbi:hypothetical protein FRUB_06078 [Fimbriiglobus ruber]|uniref:Uncharacterized protein n=1 Tax=Fimbriiglobus ruber TaxID=1908690 RepID=A0A225DT11_9BACT|nr:hypothetical protein FRUB_06078 [Fimbriiglobus ruber]
MIFHDEGTVSPTVYLHWSGRHVPELLDELKGRMLGRYGDVDYATARFVGICHGYIEGNLSLGVFRNKFEVSDLRDRALMTEASHGDAGVVIVDVKDFAWKAYGGYLETDPTAQLAV